jgi:hypothetical protein
MYHRVLSILLAGCTLLMPSAAAQTPEATISGIVTDATRSVVSAPTAGQIVTPAARHDTSPALRDLASAPDYAEGHREQALIAQRTREGFSSNQPDPVAAQPAAPTGVSIVASFDGQSAQDNRNVLGFAYVPPDTNGAVGVSQYVQMVNVTIAVYDKATGALQLGPAAIHTLWKGFGGPCETAGDGGDPVVLHDQLANRWFVSQLQYNSNFTSNQECVAVSTTSDATGSYNRYQFDFGSELPDYPKFGVWPDAYYSSQNMFVPFGGTFSFEGARACALNRAAMLAGADAAMICFQTTAASLLPSDLDGSTLPPSGSRNYFASLADSSHLNLFQFHADFTQPANSSFTGPALIAVAPFTEVCRGALVLACIPEPPPGERLDSLGDRLMFRLAYRNFGDHESLAANHTIKSGAFAGVRWYEIRSPGTAPVVYQQGTVIDPVNSFWMGSIAMDKAGDIALGFSASSRSLDPSIYAAGRTPSDQPGVMNGPTVLMAGTGVQTTSYNRWGDYSAMTVDPTDDCTFWYTQQYYQTTGSFNWSTRISAFKFDNCKAHGK